MQILDQAAGRQRRTAANGNGARPACARQRSRATVDAGSADRGAQWHRVACGDAHLGRGRSECVPTAGQKQRWRSVQQRGRNQAGAKTMARSAAVGRWRRFVIAGCSGLVHAVTRRLRRVRRVQGLIAVRCHRQRREESVHAQNQRKQAMDGDSQHAGFRSGRRRIDCAPGREVSRRGTPYGCTAKTMARVSAVVQFARPRSSSAQRRRTEAVTGRLPIRTWTSDWRRCGSVA